MSRRMCWTRYVAPIGRRIGFPPISYIHFSSCHSCYMPCPALPYRGYTGIFFTYLVMNGNFPQQWITILILYEICFSNVSCFPAGFPSLLQSFSCVTCFVVTVIHLQVFPRVALYGLATFSVCLRGGCTAVTDMRHRSLSPRIRHMLCRQLFRRKIPQVHLNFPPANE